MPHRSNLTTLDEQREAAQARFSTLWRDGILSRDEAYRRASKALDRAPLSIKTLTPAGCVRLIGFVEREQARARLAAKPKPRQPSGCAHLRQIYDDAVDGWRCRMCGEHIPE